MNILSNFVITLSLISGIYQAKCDKNHVTKERIRIIDKEVDEILAQDHANSWRRPRKSWIDNPFGKN